MDSELLLLGGSLVAVLLLVGMTWLLGFRQQARLDSPAEAAELVRLAPGGFEPVEVAMDLEGKAAIARDRDGRLLVLVPHGNRFVARPLPADCSPAYKDGKLQVSCEGHPVTLDLGAAAGDWTAADSAVN